MIASLREWRPCCDVRSARTLLRRYAEQARSYTTTSAKLRTPAPTSRWRELKHGFPPAVAARRLCTRNAFVLQALGERLIDADYETRRARPGFLPPVTSEQIGRLLGQVEVWLSQARRAAGDNGYRIDAELALPADLPEWVTAGGSSRAHQG